MRIIGGKFKGQKLEFLKNPATRPLKDSVKENIFNILEHSKKIKVKINESNVLDFYSGIGSFGLECLSRGAKRITFVEYDNSAVKILRLNLSKISSNNKAFVFNQKTQTALNDFKTEKFDIFFLDPPFKNKEFLIDLKLIKKKKLFKKNHIVVLHREKKTADELKNILEIFEEKIYGRSKIIFGKII